MIDAISAYDIEHAKAARTPIYQVRIQATPGASSIPTPTAYWNLNESDGIRSDSIGTNHLTDNNTVGSTSGGTLGTWAQFIAANTEYLSHADNATLSTGNIDFTIAAWVQLDTKPSEGDIVSKDDGATQREFNLRYRGGATDRFDFLVSSNGASTTNISANTLGAPSIGARYFVVAWHDSVNDILGISVNAGAADTLGYPSGAFNSTSEFDIGRSVFGAGTYWDGKIGPVGFWKTVLTSSHISYLYNQGVGRTIDTILNVSTYDFCTSRPIGGEDIGDELLIPRDLYRNVEIDKGRFPLSTLTFELQDIDGAVSPVIAAGINGRQCDLYAGYYDLPWSVNYVQLFRGIITGIDHLAGTYKIIARSPMVNALEKVIFKGPQTRLSADLSSSGTTISVVDATYFASASDTPQAARRQVLVDNEIIVYRGKTANTLTNCIRVTTFPFFVPPGFPDTVSVAHNSGTPVRELVGMMSLTVDNDEVAGTINDQHPIDYLNTILTNTDAKYGIGLSASYVNTEELVAVRAALGSTLRFRFLESDGSNGKDFLEKEIYLPLAAYPTEDERGRMGIKLYQSTPSTVVDTIKDQDIVEYPRWLRNAERLINTVIYHYDYNPLTKEYTSTYKYQDAALLAQHGRELPLEIFSKGIRSYFAFGAQAWFSATAAFLTAAAQRHIARFGNKSPVIQAQTIFAKELLEVGDDIQATFSNVVSLSTAARSVTDAPMEIASMRFDFRSNLIDMELLGYPQ